MYTLKHWNGAMTTFLKECFRNLFWTYSFFFFFIFFLLYLIFDVISDIILMGYIQCRRGRIHRTWHPLFPALCKLGIICLVSIYLSDQHALILLVFLAGIQGQECCCSACQKSWKGWFQSYCSYSWYPKVGPPGGWHQEQVQISNKNLP